MLEYVFIICVSSLVAYFISTKGKAGNQVNVVLYLFIIYLHVYFLFHFYVWRMIFSLFIFAAHVLISQCSKSHSHYYPVHPSSSSSI